MIKITYLHYALPNITTSLLILLFLAHSVPHDFGHILLHSIDMIFLIIVYLFSGVAVSEKLKFTLSSRTPYPHFLFHGV